MSDLPPPCFSVCIDDARDCGTINVKDPRVALTVLRRLHRHIERLYMDNDMGYGPEFEGYKILRQFLQDCQNQRHYPAEVMVVTGNIVARDDMFVELKKHGYTQNKHDPRWFTRG